MRPHSHITIKLVSACVAALVIACNGKKPDGDAPKEPDVSEAKNVPTVLNVKCVIQSAQRQLIVTAEGEVPTGGWTSPVLKRRVHVTPPADSIWEYDFVATPPSGMATQVMTPISAEDTWPDYPAQQIVGVRIYGEGGGIKEMRLTGCTTQ
jgi:hypothetical protein